MRRYIYRNYLICALSKARPGKGTSKGTSKPAVSEQVLCLLSVMDEDMSIRAMMNKLRFSSRDKFIANYLNPATVARLVEMTQPDSPKSPTQKYRLTDAGKALLE